MKRIKNIIGILLILLICSGCTKADIRDLSGYMENSVQEALELPVSQYQTNKKTYYSYYLPLSVGRRQTTESSDVLVVNGREVQMSLNASAVVSEKYYTSMATYLNTVENEQAVFSKVYQTANYLNRDMTFSVNLFEIDHQYFLMVRTMYFYYLCECEIYEVPDLLRSILSVARTTSINSSEIIAAYSNKEVITYSQEAQSIFAQNVPENGTLEQMLKDYYPKYDLNNRETATDSEEFYNPRQSNQNAGNE